MFNFATNYVNDRVSWLVVVVFWHIWSGRRESMHLRLYVLGWASREMKMAVLGAVRVSYLLFRKLNNGDCAGQPVANYILAMSQYHQH